MPSASTAACVHCTQPSKYTCPTCTARTCSLGCSKAHKANCSPTVSTTSAVAGPSTPAPGGQYVPLTQYNESHLMQDYLFLSSISRTTAETGRKIAALNLLPAPTPSGERNNAGGGGRQTSQQRQREQLMKQIHYRRFKVMLLPDGMARRRANQSAFAKGKFGLSVELKFPTSQTMLHRQDPTTTIETIIMTELQHRSFSHKELSHLRSSSPSRTWFVSTAVLEELNLPSAGKQVEDAVWRVDAWPREWVVHVPVCSARLTNESTTRYLEWWSRKRRWEEENPALAAMQREQREEEERESKRIRVEQTECATVDEAQSGEVRADAGDEVGMEGIVSSSLLSMLSQRLGRAPAPSPPPPSDPSSATFPDPPTTPAPNDPAPSLILHLTHPSHTSLAWLLTTLPDGYSVVEFPELRIGPTSRVALDKVVPLHGEGVGNVLEESADGEAKAKEEVTTRGSLAGLLAGYASDSDDAERDEPEDKVDEAAETPGGSLASLALKHGFT